MSLIIFFLCYLTLGQLAIKSDNHYIKVAVLDSGITKELDFFQGVIFEEVNLIHPGEKIVDDFNHGTPVAGIIVGKEKAPISKKLKIYDIKLLDEKGNGSIDHLIEAIDWCIDKQVDFVNISFGFQTPNAQLESTINKALEQGITIVAAAGNTYGLATDYPAKLDGVLSIGSINEQNKRSSFSAIGKINYVFHGENVLSINHNGRASDFTGTSFAAAYATNLFIQLKETYKEVETKVNFNAYLQQYTVTKDFWNEAEYGKGTIFIQ
ncbi:S8 family peptidase [Lysinibacillus sp. NPDC097195]|uniref:S8 family peptidase n=1 Tax=Lysinibacillus sp. NPDC097195 TaxID=3364141 RepID=UPI003813C88C